MIKTTRHDRSRDPARDFENDYGRPADGEWPRHNADYLCPLASREARFGLIEQFRGLPVTHQIGCLSICLPVFLLVGAILAELFAVDFNIGPIEGLLIFFGLFAGGAWLTVVRCRLK
jgi:hypothetical protein